MKPTLRRTIAGLGLILLIIGFSGFLYPTHKAYTETEEIHKWDLESRVLAPSGQDQDSLFLARLMNSSRSFQLNLSSSNTIGLLISISRHDPEGKDPIFVQTGTSFDQIVQASVTGTYNIDIKNLNPTPVTLHGSILTLQENTKYHTAYPYAPLSFLVILAGSITLLFGILKTKKPSRLKAKRKS